MAKRKTKKRIKEDLEALKRGEFVPQRQCRYSPRFIQVARTLSAAGIDSNVQLASYFNVDESTVRSWRNKDPAFNAAIETGCMEMVAECTHRMLTFSREGSETATRYLLDRRADGFKPKQQLDHVSNGNTLKALLAEHGAMSMQEARERGLIYDAEDGPLLDDVEYEEAPYEADGDPEPLDEFDEDGRPAKPARRLNGHHAGKGWQEEDMDDLRRRGLIRD
jgi:hypothetical protein